MFQTGQLIEYSTGQTARVAYVPSEGTNCADGGFIIETPQGFALCWLDLETDDTPDAEAWWFDREEAPWVQTLCAALLRYDVGLDARRIGDAFARLLREAITAEDFPEMQRRNALDGYGGGVCASHDFCDANMTMAQAFREVMGRDPAFLNDAERASSGADIVLWGDAWAAAKREHLTAR